jgi:hypothetical protein
MLVVVSGMAGCSAPLSQAPQSMKTGLQPFLDGGYTCSGPSSDNSAFSQWVCDRGTAEGTSYHLVVDADEEGIKQVLAIVDQSPQPTADRVVAVEFFAQVASIDLGASARDLSTWISSSIAEGGQRSFGPVFATLEGIRPVCHLTLFVER